MALDQLSSDPAFLAAYGAVVGQLREEHGLDRKELASVADISYSYLSAIESGQRLPSAAVQDALAAALGIEASDLLARANGEVETGPVPPPAEYPVMSATVSMEAADASPKWAPPTKRAVAPTARMAPRMSNSEPQIGRAHV